MNKKMIALFAGYFIFIAYPHAQSVSQKLQKAFTGFEKDTQLTHAISSLYVMDAKTGQVVFDKNSGVGLVPASTQKIITGVTAFELLGKDYRYQTELGYDGKVEKEILHGNVYITGSGDPTLGSWRWRQTRDSLILKKWVTEIKKLKIKRINGFILTNTSKFHYNAIPDGWIWQDIGNYYGAGAYILNWKENQYDLALTSENKPGGSVEVKRNGQPSDLNNYLKAGRKGSGDNAYIYYDNSISGTIPPGEKNFIISGAVTDPVYEILLDFNFALMTDSVNSEPRYGGYTRDSFSDDSAGLKTIRHVYTHYSPALDSIIYWFNKKSINLYGEALLKTFAYEKQGFAFADSGVVIVKNFWKQKGISDKELNICDGSGLSPLNRVTTHAQVTILKYAKTKDWFPYFYNSLPEYNGMKMKSGTIRDVKGFCGYHKAKNGREYIFSFLVNNYNGSAGELVRKMYKVLDILK
jgi:D-alanyl-D-alanine carboxypeptidase/D-alanyl-D-alanine-endopeptidase (penicillin-binding protein 4)